jgi:hypothetical protein
MPEKNPKRVAAGRKNRAKRGPLSAESRAKLRQHAFDNRPWEHATGPTSVEGKVRSARKKTPTTSASRDLAESAIKQLGLLKSLRKQCYIDPSEHRFLTGGSVAAQLQQLFEATSQQVVKQQAELLLRDFES